MALDTGCVDTLITLQLVNLATDPVFPHHYRQMG